MNKITETENVVVKSDRPRQKEGLAASIARFVRRLFRGDTAARAPMRQEYARRGPTPRMRRGKKGNAGASVKRYARARRRAEIAEESRRRNRI